jgi:hypothetical protein
MLRDDAGLLYAVYGACWEAVDAVEFVLYRAVSPRMLPRYG